MRVNMNIAPAIIKHGLFKKVEVSQITLDVQFTEEQKYKIKQLGILEETLFIHPYLSGDAKSREIFGTPDGIHYLIRNLLEINPLLVNCDNLFKAKEALNHIEEQVRNLKSHLHDAEPESRTLDL